MAVGKGSMARAAKAADKKAAAPAKKTSGKAVAAAETIAAPAEEVLQQIVYQKSDGVLERDAAPNEIFGLGDAMPVYYF